MSPVSLADVTFRLMEYGSGLELLVFAVAWICYDIVKNPPTNAGDVRHMGLIPGSGRSPAGRHGNPLQCSCLENPMDRRAWWAIVHGVAKSQIQLKRL